VSKQPSERAFDVASDWQGHKFECAIHRDPGRDDTDCTCIVRDLALAIDAALAAARAEAYELAATLCDAGYNESPTILAKAIRALAAQEARDGAQ